MILLPSSAAVVLLVARLLPHQGDFVLLVAALDLVLLVGAAGPVPPAAPGVPQDGAGGGATARPSTQAPDAAGGA